MYIFKGKNYDTESEYLNAVAKDKAEYESILSGGIKDTTPPAVENIQDELKDDKLESLSDDLEFKDESTFRDTTDNFLDETHDKLEGLDGLLESDNDE